MDKFIEKKNGVIILSERGRVKLSKIRANSIFRGQAIGAGKVTSV